MSDIAIRGRNVLFRYGPSVAIESSTFEIPTGAITALIGPNGSGKSTLLNGIAGITKPFSGSIEVLPSGDGSRRIAYVLQASLVVFFFCRYSGMPVLEVLLPRRGDVAMMWEMGRELISALKR